ncbi:MAG: hypothetical protein AB7U63_19735 [Porticoccaceae bacterium]
MPTRFEAYRMRDGVTPLAADYFNPVLSDIDGRVAKIEDQRADLQAVIDDLSRFGLTRIDTLLGPALATLKDQLDGLTQRRDELIASIESVGDLVTPTQLTEAITAEQTARQEAITEATAPPTQSAFTFDAAGRVATITETLPTGSRVTTASYDASGRISQLAIAFNGTTRTETYAFDATGQLTGITATETTP